MNKFTSSINNFKNAILSGKNDSKFNFNFPKIFNESNKIQKENSPNLSNISDENIQKSTDIIEDIIFIHS